MIATNGRQHPARSSWRGRSDQAGLTLIEMVVTLAIISIAVVGIVYGFSAIVRSAGDAQVQAELDAAAQTAADYVQSVLPYCPCDANCGGATYSLNGLPMPPDVTSWSLASVTESNSDSNLGLSGKGCGSEVDYGVQEITLTVSDGPTSVSRTVWKGAQS